ncbi:hypothetical protein [Leuconostoc pseudomesenteroides]
MHHVVARLRNLILFLVQSMQDTKIIAVRHNEGLTDQLKVRFVKSGKVHDIKYISSDESNTPIAFDYVTIDKEPLGALDGT